MSIASFSRKVSSAVSRLAFWDTITAKLADFDSLLKNAHSLTPEDTASLKDIHRRLYECYGLAKKRLLLHSQRINTLRKELHNGSKTFNQ